MAFTVLGITFIMIFGVEIAYQEFFPPGEPDLDGHPVRINNSQIIPMVGSNFNVFFFSWCWNNFHIFESINFFIFQTESFEHLNAEEVAQIIKQAEETREKEWRRRVIVFAGLICVGTFAGLGSLTWWHAGLIARGETSIEARINSTESAKYKAMGRTYENPYDFGPRENWRIFLGLRNR